MGFRDPFDWYVKEGLLKRIEKGRLSLYNYTDRCVFTGNWNFHTRLSRGLVLDADGSIVARPFPKFFNLNERPETRLEALPSETPELSDKLDGSLVIVFWNPETGEWDCCTRGSWDNDQVRSVKERWLPAMVRKGGMIPGRTYLLELVAPWNRIVILYSTERLVLVGAVENVSGADSSYAHLLETAVGLGVGVVVFRMRLVSDVDLEDSSIVNEEGFVARWPGGFRVKLKYAQYLQLHKILTGLSTMGIWESLASGKPISLERVPDEFHRWFDAEQAKLREKYRRVEDLARFAYHDALPHYKDGSRKSFADFVRGFEPTVRSCCFRMLDQRPYDDVIWKSIRPRGGATFTKDER